MKSNTRSMVSGAGETVASEVEPWIRRMARLGYIAKGIVYLVIGVLAVRAAMQRTDPEDSRGALVALVEQPFGQVMLGIVAVGLIGYVVWRLVLTFRDPEGRGGDAKGLAVRAGYLISALLYSGLAVGAVRLVLNGGGGSGAGGDQDGQARSWTAMAMSQPFGRWAVAGIGAAIILFGLYEIYRSVTTDFVKRLNLLRLPYNSRRNLIRAGRLGLAARGIVFGLIGWFVVQAALQFDPNEARGLAGALETLQRQPYGPYLLGLVAIGLFAYGVFQIMKGRYGVIATG